MSDGRPTKSQPDILCCRCWAYHLLHYANEAYASGKLEGKFSAPPSWASIERFLAESSNVRGASLGRLQGLERAAKFGHDPSKVARRISIDDWKEAGFELPEKTDGAAKSRHVVVKLNLVDLAEMEFPGSKGWYDTKVWKLLKVETLSLRDVEHITEHCLQQLGFFRTHLSVTGGEPFNRETVKDYVFSRRPETADELVAQYATDLLPLVQDPTPNGLTLLTSMLFEASYLGDELLTDIHGELLVQALENMKKRSPLGEPIGKVYWEGAPSLALDQNFIGLLGNAIFDAATEFADRNLPPAHRMSLVFPPRKNPRADPK